MADNKNTNETTSGVTNNTSSNAGADNGVSNNQSNAGAAKGTKGTKGQTEKMVEVFIPKQNRGDTERFVAVNGERILVQTGKKVKVPERFAEVIKNSQEMAAVSDAYIEANISK